MFEAKQVFNRNFGFGVMDFVQVSIPKSGNINTIKYGTEKFEGLITGEYDTYFVGEKLNKKGKNYNFTIHKADLYTGSIVVKKLRGDKLAV